MEDKRFRRKELILLYRKKREPTDAVKTKKPTIDGQLADSISASLGSQTLSGETENIHDSRQFE